MEIAIWEDSLNFRSSIFRVLKERKTPKKRERNSKIKRATKIESVGATHSKYCNVSVSSMYTGTGLCNIVNSIKNKTPTKAKASTNSNNLSSLNCTAFFSFFGRY